MKFSDSISLLVSASDEITLSPKKEVEWFYDAVSYFTSLYELYGDKEVEKFAPLLTVENQDEAEINFEMAWLYLFINVCRAYESNFDNFDISKINAIIDDTITIFFERRKKGDWFPYKEEIKEHFNYKSLKDKYLYIVNYLDEKEKYL